MGDEAARRWSAVAVGEKPTIRRQPIGAPFNGTSGTVSHTECARDTGSARFEDLLAVDDVAEDVWLQVPVAMYDADITSGFEHDVSHRSSTRSPHGASLERRPQ